LVGVLIKMGLAVCTSPVLQPHTVGWTVKLDEPYVVICNKQTD